MARTPFTITQHELIGLEIDARIDNQEGVIGTVVDETKENLTILAGKRFKRVNKSHMIFTANLNGTVVKVDGEAIARRPEDRIKK